MCSSPGWSFWWIGGMGYIENAALITQSSSINPGNNAISGVPVTVDSGASHNSERFEMDKRVINVR